MKLPWTTFPLVAMKNAVCSLPQMTLRAAGAVPPIVLPFELNSMLIASSSLGTAAVPLASVPKKFPSIRFPPLLNRLIPLPEPLVSPRKPLITSPRTVEPPPVIVSPLMVATTPP